MTYPAHINFHGGWVIYSLPPAPLPILTITSATAAVGAILDSVLFLTQETNPMSATTYKDVARAIHVMNKVATIVALICADVHPATAKAIRAASNRCGLAADTLNTDEAVRPSESLLVKALETVTTVADAAIAAVPQLKATLDVWRAAQRVATFTLIAARTNEAPPVKDASAGQATDAGQGP